MPVNTTTPRISYTANGVTTTFDYPFRILTEADLKVYFNGVVQDSGYTVSGVDSDTGGSIEITVPPDNGVTILLQRETVIDRQTDYVEGGAMTSATLDSDFDRIVMQVQNLDSVAFKQDGTEQLDALGRRMKNVADPVDPQDAATKNWTETFLGTSVTDAAASAAVALDWAIKTDGAVSGGELSAKAHATAASGSASSASTSATNANNSAIAAAGSAEAAALSASSLDTASFMVKSDNLFGLTNTSTAQGNLGLGTASVVNTGTGATNVPLVSNILGKQTVGIPAGAMKPRVTDGPSAVVVQLATNGTLCISLDFNANNISYAQFSIPAPASFDNTVGLEAVFEWTHPTTTVNFGCSWAIRAKYVSDGDPLDGAWSSWVQVDDVGGVTDTVYVSPVATPITPAGTYNTGCVIRFELKRVADDAIADTLTVDARLHLVTLKYTTKALNDA